MPKQPAIRNRYISKETTITLLLIGGVSTNELKADYGIDDKTIREARKRIRELGLLEEVKTHG